MKKRTNNHFVSMFIWVLACMLLAAPSDSLANCASDDIVLHYEYLGACGYTQSSSFTLTEDKYITRIRIWYDTYMGGNTLSATLSGPDGYNTSSGTINVSGCYGNWCAAMWDIEQTLKTGTYTLVADNEYVCSNPSGETTLILYGCDPKEVEIPDGLNPPSGISVIDKTTSPSDAPLYMGNIITTNNTPLLSGKMELSIDFPAYNKPVDIWILIALPDNRFYLADESGNLHNLESSGFLPIASGVFGTKTQKRILTPFETGSYGNASIITPFDPWPHDGAWTVYWLIAPEINGDILAAIAKGDYELGFYSFEVKTEPSATDEPGVSIAPANHITHSSGASADVPEREISYNDKVSLEQISLPDNSRLWNWDNTGWQFTSTGGLTIENEVIIKLPATGIEGETILAHSHTGDWIKLDAQSTTLDSGSPGLQVKIKEIPTPWVLVVAKPAGTEPVKEEVPQSTLFEQLYWTDREQWKTDITNWIVDIINTEAGEEDTATKASSKTVDILQIEKELTTAYNFLNAAKVGGVLDQAASGTPLPGIGLSPFALYLDALDRLWKVRNDWFNFTMYLESKGVEWKETYYYSDDRYIEQAIESALAYYAPWGIDFMRFMLHTGIIGSFDMRIIGPYGEQLYSDVQLSSCDKNGLINSDITKLKTDDTQTYCYLRLYSRKAVATSWMDYLKDGTLETFVRYLPTALAASGLVSGGWTTPLIFAAADQLLDYVQSYYEDDAKTYLAYETAATSADVGSFVTDITAAMLRVKDAEISVPTGALGVAQSLYSLALLYGVSQTDWFMLKEIKPLTSMTRSYCPDGDCTKSLFYGDTFPVDGYDQIPPIQLIAILQGTPQNHPEDGYPAGQTRVTAWTIPLSEYRTDLHRYFIQGSSCEQGAYDFSGNYQPQLCQTEKIWKGGLADIPFSAYEKDKWPVIINRTEPAAQSIRVSVPQSTLDKIAKYYELSSSPNPEEYGLLLRVEAKDGSRALFQILNFDEKRPGDDAQKKYFTVVIYGKWKGDDASLEGLDSKYDGHRAKMSGSLLQAKLNLTLFAHSDQEARAEGVIDFTSKDGKELLSLNPYEIDPYPVDAERVHVGSVDLKGNEVPEDNCYLREDMFFDSYNASVRVNFKSCNEFQSLQWDIPLCFQLGPNGTIIPDAYCSQGGNDYIQESLTGSWSCNSINISFVTSGSSQIDPPGAGCWGACVNTEVKFSGTATISADSNYNMISRGSGNLSQTYTYTTSCCPTKTPGTETCEKTFATQ